MFVLVFLLLFGGVACSPAKKPRYGVIKSPNYPKAYPNNNHSSWNIAVPEGYHISLKFVVFDIEPSDGCTYDFVKVFEDKKELGRFCGPPKSKAHPGHRLFVSEGNQMRIEFQSDFSNEENGSTVLYPGFQAYYQAVDNDECALSNDISATWTPPCQHVCHNYIGGYFCSCLPGYKLQSDKRSCKVECSSQLFVEESGYIFSPEYPKPYPADLNCNYSIRVEEGLHISITFVNTFDIDYHPRAQCPYDTLKSRPVWASSNLTLALTTRVMPTRMPMSVLYTHYTVDSNFLVDAPALAHFCEVVAGGSPLGTYCGRTSPGNLKTLSNKVDILFHTDDSGDSKGWKLHYTTHAVQCPMPIAQDELSMISPVKEEYEMRDYIVVTCRKGYQLMENTKKLSTFTAVCQKDGTWNRPMPQCQIVSCRSPEKLRNGQYTFLTQPNRLTYLSAITYSCNEPYYKIVTQRQSAKFTCLEDGNWKDENGGFHIPICVPVCGEPANPISGHGRIIKGEKAVAGNFPWQVLLLKNGRGGGILIGEQWVMTAAHVIRPPKDSLPDDYDDEDADNDINGLHVFIGDLEVDNLLRIGTLAIHEVFVHPNYTSINHDHDIALIRLKEPVVMDENISPICLPESNNETLYDADTLGYVSGFGVTERNRIANTLRYVALPMVQREKCEKQLKEKQKGQKSDSKVGRETFSENMFCAGFPEAQNLKQDSCQGDSGGPYAIESKDKWVAAGIVSWGIGCGKGYGYYTKVNRYIDWINGHLNM